MLGWIFKRQGIKSGSAPAEAPSRLAAEVSAPQVDWTAALARARGDDEALLTLASTAGAPLPFKQGAVEALTGEAALRLAEREFRSHDRRVHQVARQRLQAKVAQRLAREEAERLIQDARNLAGGVDVPANRVVELDRAWASLDADAIETARRDEFGALSARLTGQLRQRADLAQQLKHWQAAARAAVGQLQVACTGAAAGTQDRTALSDAASAARGVTGALPPDGAAEPATARALADLQQAIETATTLDGHLLVLDRLLAASAETQPLTAGDLAGEQLPLGADDALRSWQALPPLPDAGLAALLQSRQARWQVACDRARQARQLQRREQAREHQRGRQVQQRTALVDHLALAEAALDDGQLVEAHRLLSDIDEQLQGADASDALQTRIQAAQARLAQLRGWQHWAGRRARDELVLQAEALAVATVAGDGRVDGQVQGDAEVLAEVARLSIRQRADLIQTLRQRWKEIDSLGGGGDQALWRRFDAALAAAGEPVAAHVSAQRAARQANLSARLELLEVLEAAGAAGAPGLADGAGGEGAAAGIAGPDAKTEPPAQAPEQARRLASALDRFQTEWRKLGPLAHTVPRAAQGALLARLQSALSRLEAPLQAARALAGAQRQTLVARARGLADEASGRNGDLVVGVRALQAEWQQQAKALPLSRADEQALWADFKAAIDAAFAAREAVYSAREAEIEAHAAERSALIERLRAGVGDSPPTQRRLLAEVDEAWRRCGPAPRARAATLDAGFRAARDALSQSLEGSQQRAWRATCDALDAKLSLCQAGEQGRAGGTDPDVASTTAAWSTLPLLPEPLESALRRRAGLAPSSSPVKAPDVDGLLLDVEIAWNLPTPPAFESARRARKLLAMKLSLEGRRAALPQGLAPVAAMAMLLACADLDEAQRERLAAVLANWRLQGP